MNMITIGPLMFSTDRFAAILAVATFWVVMAVAGRLLDRRLAEFASIMILAGVVGARLMHVLVHIQSFAVEPWRVVYIWQGGFNLWGGLLGLLAVALWKVRGAKGVAVTAGSTLSAFAVWGLVFLLASETTHASLPRNSLDRYEGDAVALAELNTQPMVINLWATWCPPCVREMPLMSEADRANPDITFAFVNQGEGAEEIAAFLESQGLEIENILLDPSWSTSQHYEARGLPTTLFVDADGTVSSIHAGEVSPELLDVRLESLR